MSLQHSNNLSESQLTDSRPAIPPKSQHVVEKYSTSVGISANLTTDQRLRPESPAEVESYGGVEGDVAYNITYRTHESAPRKIKRLSPEEFDNIKLENSGCALEIIKTVEVIADDKDKEHNGHLPPITEILDEEMKIYSPYLLKIMPEVTGYWPDYDTLGWSNKVLGVQPQLKLKKPYRMLATSRAREALKQKREYHLTQVDRLKTMDQNAVAESQITAQHIEYLENELDKALGTRIEEEEKRWKQDPPVATFDMLWLLFQPGTVVCGKFAEEVSACRVHSCSWDESKLNPLGPESVQILMWYLDFDGRFLFISIYH